MDERVDPPEDTTPDDATFFWVLVAARIIGVVLFCAGLFSIFVPAGVSEANKAAVFRGQSTPMLALCGNVLALGAGLVLLIASLKIDAERFVLLAMTALVGLAGLMVALAMYFV